MGMCVWPAVFISGKLETTDRAKACADALCGWGNCDAGFGPLPENFGKGMAAIGSLLQIAPTPNGLMKYADKIYAELDAQKTPETKLDSVT